METIKRIEIIISSLELPAVLKALRQEGIVGYSIVRNVIGNGERGFVDDDLGGFLSNDYILTTCAVEQEARVAEVIRPLLEKFGGACIISDAKWITHEGMLF